VIGVLVEITAQTIGGDDDRVLLETPARRFLLSRQELQTGRLEVREAFIE